MDANKTKTAIEQFSKYVVQQARTNLTKQDRNVSRKLYDSIGYDLKVGPRSFELNFLMEEYGQFQDQGVKGKLSASKAPRSPFRFGSGTGKKGGLTKGIRQWVEARRFQFKDRETGRFLSYEQTARAITRSIYNKGMKPTMFFSGPFEKGFKRLPDDVLTAYGLDIETFFKYASSE